MSVDFREFTAIACKGLNHHEARRVGKALDCAIMFGVLEVQTPGTDPFLRNVEGVRAELEKRMNELRKF